MTLLTKDQILKGNDRPHEMVDVPEWGGSVRVIPMTAAERDGFEAGMLNSKGKSDAKHMANFRARFIASCMVDESDTRLFTNADVVALGKRSAAAVNKVFEVCRRINGMTQEDLKEIEGN